jgi:tryptophan halogenase
MDSAITLPSNLDLDKGIEPYTKASALSSGWTWKIPTQKRYGNGYVFSSNYISSDEALNELNQHLNINTEKPSKYIQFETGRIDKSWVKNCVSIGLSSGFVEPLEAQSIGSSIVQSFALINYFQTWLLNPKSSNKYNQQMSDTFNNTVDYIQLHYYSIF